MFKSSFWYMEPAEWHKSTWVNMNKHDQCFFWTSLQIQKPSRLSLFLSLFCKVLLPLLSFHIFATISLDFLVWATSCHILPRHATTGPLLAGWVSIKWRGLTTHLHHKQGDLYKMEGSNSHLHHITLLLCGREQRNWSSRGQNQHSEAISALTLLQSSTSSAILSHLCHHPSW
jgi:hypothetical protein